ncbi:MAG: FG-GAP-like repeat-containing protein [Armatimonadota bacterium]
MFTIVPERPLGALLALMLIATTATTLAVAQEERAMVMLNNCDSLDGVVVTTGAGWPETRLELNTDPLWKSEGEASIHASTVSPADAQGNSYLSIDVPIGDVDVTGQAIIFDAWTSQPQTTRALYVRGYNAAGECVLSYLNWGGPLGDGSKKTIELVRGFSLALAWEPTMVQTDDTSSVVTLRFYVGTPGQGVPMDLYIDNIRMAESNINSFADVTEPKPLVLQTPIVTGGAPRAQIVSPSDPEWRAVADEVQALFTDLTGVRLPIVSANEIDDAAMKASTAILVGSVSVNPRMLYPYTHGCLFAADVYPGGDGYEVRTVHDPWGTGQNMLSVGASTPAGARAGIAALREQLTAGADLVLEPTLLVKLSPEAQRRWGAAFTAELDDAWLEAVKAGAQQDLESGAHTGLFGRATGIGRNYQLTGRDEYARAFVWMILRAQQWANTGPTVFGGPWGFDSDFQAYQIFPAWDVIEESPALSDEDRMAVTRALFQWTTDAIASEAASSMGANRPRHNHNTFAALGSMYAGEYFSKYYGVTEGERWLAIADDCFTDQAKYFKSHEDCNGYQWLTLYHTMRYALARPDFTWFENGNVRRVADYAIMCMDNLGYSVTYGDTGAYVGWWSEMPFLEGAYWYYRDPRIAWINQRKRAVSGRMDLSWCATNGEGAEPTELIGAQAFPLEPAYWRALGGEGRVPLERAVDKVVFRDGFDPQHQYMLLDGLNNGGHHHYDGNSISRITANGRIWLADASYMDSLPKFHSTALVLRDGESAPLPDFVELEHLRDLPDVGFSETALRDYAGVDWHRNIFWLKGEWFLVADEMTAREAGDYSFRMLWHTIGDVELGVDGLSVEQAGQHCAIRMTPELRFTLDHDAAYGANWRGYEFVDEAVVHKLQGIWNGRLAAGESVTLFTLIHPSGAQASPLHLTRLGPNQVAITGDEAPTIAAVGDGTRTLSLAGQGGARAHAVLMRPGLLALFDATSVGYGGDELTFGGSDVQMALGEGDLIVFPQAGRTAMPATQQTTEFIPELAAFGDLQVRTMLEAAIAAAPPAQPPQVGAGEAAELTKLWDYGETLDSYLLTGNRGVFGAVDTGMALSCDPQPLAANVFGAEDGTNTLDNIVDGGIQALDECVMWDDDQPVTIDLSFDGVYDIDSITVRAWFATSSSRGKLFQVQNIAIAASNDGFANDRRQIVEFTDTEQHGNWGAPGHAPHDYEFGDLGIQAKHLRLSLTPRPGTAIYLAEVEVRGTREGIEALVFRPDANVQVHSFLALHSADVDGDGADELVAASSNGSVYLFESDGSLAWQQEIGGRVRAVTTANFPGQERPAIVAGGTSARLHAFTAGGEELWTFEFPIYHGAGVVTSVFPADLTGDGHHAVIAGTEGWRYYAVDSEGNEIWHVESVRMSTVGAAGDLDGDGRDEVVAGTEYHSWPVYDSDGSRLFSYAPRTGPGTNDVLIDDLDGDGAPEIAFAGRDSFVHVVNATGGLLFKFGTGDEVTSLTTVSAPDGGRLLVAGSRSFNVYAFDAAGNVVWRTDLGYPVTDVAALRTAAGERVAATTDSGSVVLLDAADGALLGRHQLLLGGITLVAADLDGDGAQELAVSSRDGNLTALR